MVDIKLFGRPFLTVKKTISSVNAAVRWLLEQWDNGDAEITQGNAYGKHVWVYSCVNAIARNIAQIPFRLFRVNTDKEITSGPAYEFFYDPSPMLSKFQLWEGTETYKQIRGESFWHLLRGGVNVVSIEFLEPSRMEPVIVDGLLKGWNYAKEKGGKVLIDPEEIVHFKFFNPYNNYRGLSPLTAAMLGIQIDDDVRKFDRNILRNGSYPGSLIESPEVMTDDDFARFKQRMDAGHKGVNKAGALMILEGGAKYKELKITPQEMQFLDKKRMAREETAAVFKVPPIEIGIFEDANRANADVQTKMFWTKCLIPEMRYIEDVLNTSFFPRLYPDLEGRFDLTAIKELAEDLEKASQTAQRFYSMGVPLAELNKRLDLGFDLSRVPWKDTVLVPFNLVPISDIVSGAATTPPASADERMARALGEINKYHIDGNKVVMDKERKHYIHWKRFIQRLNPLISKMQNKVSRYVFEARQRVLEKYMELTKSIKGINDAQIFDEAAEFGELKKTISPLILEGLKAGGQDVFDELGIAGTFDLVDQRTIDYFNRQIIKLKEITGTLREEIRLTLQEGVARNMTTADIVEALKHDFNIAGNRARTIARTEITSSANGGRVFGYIENGIEKHEWVNSFDSDVRDEHRISEIVPVGEEFSNGLKWPGDKDGSGSTQGNIINCRCTTIAVIKQ